MIHERVKIFNSKNSRVKPYVHSMSKVLWLERCARAKRNRLLLFGED